MKMFKRNETRSRLFAVAFFHGVSTTTAQVAASHTKYLRSDDTPVIEMKFFDKGEFGSAYDFNRSVVNIAWLGAAYWQNVLDLRGSQTPWQIALTASNLPILDAETFSFDNAALIQDNYLAQMLQGKCDLVRFNLQALANVEHAGQDVKAALQSHAPRNGAAALSVVTVGNYLGANRDAFSYRNCTTLTERELVAIQALGFDFDIKKFYGRSICIGKNAFIRNINNGATLEGDIVSDWRHFTAADGFLDAYPIALQYGNNSFDATKYIPDLTTHLNFNTSLDYGGNISGANNIKMHVNTGTLRFTGAADLIGVDVMRGAKLYGGTFTFQDMSADIADGFTDAATGKFINHGTIAASSPHTNLVINGDLISDGVIQKISGGTAGLILVNGNANVEGSTVTTDSPLPNQTETVLIADSITGNIKNPVGNPVPVSGMLEATGAIEGNTLTVTTYESNHTDTPEPEEKETFAAMNNMFDNLEGTEHQETMRELYNLALPEAKITLTQIGSNDSAQVMSVARQNTAVDKMISDRVTRIFAPEYVDVNVRPINFAEDDSETAPGTTIIVKVPARHENNFWLNYAKNWGSLRGGTDYHGSVIVGGYDKPFGSKIRAGVFASYGTIGYGADSSRATVYDTRLGLYAGYHNRASVVYSLRRRRTVAQFVA